MGCAKKKCMYTSGDHNISACILRRNLELTKNQTKVFHTTFIFYIQAFYRCQYLACQALTKSSNLLKTAILGPIMAETASPPGLGPIRPDVSRDVMPFLCTRVSLYFSSLLGCISFLLPPLLFLFFLFTLVYNSCTRCPFVSSSLSWYFHIFWISFAIPLVYRPSNTHCFHHTPFSKPTRSR